MLWEDERASMYRLCDALQHRNDDLMKLNELLDNANIILRQQVSTFNEIAMRQSRTPTFRHR